MQSEYQYTHHPASQTFPNFHHGHQVPAFMNQQIPYYLHPHQVQSESWHQA